MNWKSIVTFVGFAAAVAGLIQAFSFNHYESVVCRYEGPRKTNLLECMDRIINNKEKIVLLDLEFSEYTIYRNEAATGKESLTTFSRGVDGKFLVWKFDVINWCRELRLSCPDTDEGMNTWHTKVRLNMKENFSANGTDWKDVGFGHYGTWLYLMLDEHTLNPYSDAHADAGIDVAHGPFQVSLRNEDGLDKITLTPAPMTDSLGREVRCARRTWPMYLKFILCPFVQ